MNRRIFHLAVVLLFAVLCGRLQADWLTDGGFPQLQAELGGSLPTGAGIVVLHTEADADASDAVAFLPQASMTPTFPGTGGFAGKTFTVDSALGNESAHSLAVGSTFYGIGNSVSPGITDVHVMLADDYFEYLAGATPPVTLAGAVSNHSWIADSTGNTTDDEHAQRAHDFMINRAGVVTCVPLNNDFSVVPSLPHPIFLANCYNAVSVGVRNGQHSRGGSTSDGLGRMKPDLVVDQIYTSLACPSVASTAAMLREAIKADHMAADNPQTIKAILVAGASKDRLPGWSRASAITPYDSVHGGGELNMLNSYHILAAGRQLPDDAAETAAVGWDCNTTPGSAVRRYFLTVPANVHASTFSAVLTWHRTVTFDEGVYNSALPDLNLKLYAANGFAVVPDAVDRSVSTLDNVEHVFLRNLPPGQYALEVSSDTADVTYGLAWEAQTGEGPALAVRRESNGDVYVDLRNLDPFVTYSIRESEDLMAWSTATTVRTADTTPATTFSWEDPETPMPGRKFYKLEWTAVR